jgi:hypothetical protein
MGWHLIHETHKQEVFHRSLPSTSDYTPMLLAAISQNNSIRDVKGLQKKVKREGDLPFHCLSRVMYRSLPCEVEEGPRCSKIHPCPRS